MANYAYTPEELWVDLCVASKNICILNGCVVCVVLSSGIKTQGVEETITALRADLKTTEGKIEQTEEELKEVTGLHGGHETCS